MKEEDVLKDFLKLGLRVFFHGVDAMLHSPNEKQSRDRYQPISYRGSESVLNNVCVFSFDYSLDCQGVGTEHSRWSHGKKFFEHLLKTKLAAKGRDANLSKIFNADGFVSDVDLKVMNLKPGCSLTSIRKTVASNGSKCWEEVRRVNLLKTIPAYIVAIVPACTLEEVFSYLCWVSNSCNWPHGTFPAFLTALYSTLILTVF